jgi:hypothetical protein
MGRFAEASRANQPSSSDSAAGGWRVLDLLSTDDEAEEGDAQ